MPHPFTSISEALLQPRSRHFGVVYQNGSYTANDPLSFFARKLPDPELTFDFSNNKTLVNVYANGSIKNITVYNGSYSSDNIPGVWMCKDFRAAGPYAFSLKLGEEVYNLGSDNLPYATSLLDNLFPVTEYQLGEVKATLLVYTPVSADGTERLRGVVYGLQLENRSGQSITGEVALPSADTAKDPLFSSPEFCVHTAERKSSVNGTVSFTLAPDQSLWVPAVIYPAGDSCPRLIDGKGSLYWLNETWAYFRGITGRLEMKEDPFAAEFYERAILQCFGSLAMDSRGGLVGANWGTSPTTQFTWNKDMFYSLLPFYTAEPELFQQGMLWFLEHGIRPPGNRYEGGIAHSLSNSLSSIVMAGLYYLNTGDKQLFLDRPELHERICSLLEETLLTRKEEDPWLFPSVWLSDAYSLGDYHTGSNVIVWTAFFHYARVVEEVFGDPAGAERYRIIAGKIRDDLEQLATTEGPFGTQYTEGISTAGDKLKDNADKYTGKYADFGMQFIWNLTDNGQINLLHHDGEESDTILMPLYGYTPYDNETYRHYMQFSLSPHNPTYNPESRGIQWGDHSACTFPGYMSGMGMITDAASMSGEDGYFTQIRKLTDADGSLWWWPYNNGALYGDVVRHNNCGKCGWASGVFAGLFVSQILGLTYNASARQLTFRPLSPTSSFNWEHVRLGSGNFSVAYRKTEGSVEASIMNLCTVSVTATVELRHDNARELKAFACVGDKELTIREEWSDRLDSRLFKKTLEPGRSITFGLR
ncbi:glycoside hydrolase [Paenibacillus albidus]|uniref:Glycoside hydrolase n=1 Tax=Paenibacillus albidus TaxID=2041023 RepID=A0A917FY07_9BACL|nr:hypothetical protein [Paenibacillus albidus]GGG13061.1 glycoside hydrolase [Paenibacillus albidus]